ncbi:hypothetical protein MICRO11B_790004 [Micrococcus luteus]|nr:hypothetical protein MICRO11B_790004 [Micrococcus luteus]
MHPSNGNRRLTERPDRMKGAAHTHQMETDDSQNVRTE